MKSAKKKFKYRPGRAALAQKPDHCRAAVGKGNLSRFRLKNGGAASFARGYEVITPPQDKMRREAVVETKGEDHQLPAAKRLKITNLLRDMLRNSPAFVMQNRQMCINVVGSVGGKMYAAFPKGFEKAADEVMEYFNRVWAPSAEFTYGKGFNWLLKTVLTTKDVCGNVILVFDDGILSGGDGSGRIRAFEGDEIANISNFQQRFPKSFTQSQGFIYNQLGQFAGAFVSTTQRGRSVFDADSGVITLRRDPFAAMPGNWTVIGDMMRFNQGRAVSPLSSALISLIDLHETVSNEALAAKFNAQLVAQIVHTGSEDAAPKDQGGFDGESGAFGAPSDGETVETVEVPKNEALKNIGLHAQEMPANRRLELLDTKRPNANMPNYVDFVLGMIGGARGLARVYSLLKAQTSYAAFRGEQIMTWKSFTDMQKDLEREVCDWAARCAISRAVRMGLITSPLPDGWEHMIAWVWPRMVEVSEKDAQSALQLKLQNGVTSLKRELGPGEFEKIMAERAAEKKAFDDAGLIYPGETSVSGEIKGGGDGEDKDEDEENPLIDELNKGGTNAT